MKPCEHNSTCTTNNTSPLGYTCVCPSGFNGTHCEVDHRFCTLHICFNGGNWYPPPILIKYFSSIGTCHEQNFTCSCRLGWQGAHCQHKIDYCQGVSCHDHGFCRSVPDKQTYICECFGDSYYGEHCEHTSNKIYVKQVVSKSFAYVAILALCSVALFVLIMDILKYCFGIDPVDRERRRLQQEKKTKKRKHKPVIQRFTYVNNSSA